MTTSNVAEPFTPSPYDDDIRQHSLDFENYVPGTVPESFLKMGILLEAKRDCYLHGLADGRREGAKLFEGATELLEVATLRGDDQLPHPSDDPILWTARMQEAWDILREMVHGTD